MTRGAAKTISNWQARAAILVFAAILAAPGAPANRMPDWRNSEAAPGSAVALPKPDHTVVVIMENHAYFEVIGNSSAPFINFLKTAGANFTNSHAVTHPSQPNYLALFEAGTEAISDDSCPHILLAANLGSGLLASGQTFIGYSESMPSNGYTGCISGNYVRRHNPWVNYVNIPASSNLTFNSFPTDYTELPDVAYVVPNLCNDMHDCSVATGDAWLQSRLGGYIQWAGAHNSLFILTFDEDGGGNTATNQITTVFVGPMVRPGDYGTRIDHYGLVRTLEDMYGVPATGNARNAAAITQVWQSPPPTPSPTPTPTPAAFSTPSPQTPTAVPRAPVIRVLRPERPVRD